ncbi:MAG: DUF5703 domain-containing protein, partial [Candidatus Aminicenantales bacterium]
MIKPILPRKHFARLLFPFVVASLAAPVFSAAAQNGPFENLKELRRFDVAWDRPGNEAKDSMPLGNGDIGLNVWTEGSTGSLCFYISKTDSWDETGRLLKLSKVRVTLDPNP